MSLPRVKTHTTILKGGLDLESPLLSVGAGFALEANNIESNLMGGYRRMAGYERTDGHTAPSSATYYLLYVDDASVEHVGSSVTGSISGATAYIVGANTVDNYLGIILLSGSFVVNDVLAVATVLQSEINSPNPDSKTHAQWLESAQTHYRQFIGAVPGSGSILGVWQYNGIKYAFRSNGTKAILHASSPTGWTPVPLFSLLKFDTGVLLEGDVVAGDTITGLTGGATATVKNIIKNAGNYGSTASGYLVVDVTSGAFISGENIQKASVTQFNAVGPNYPIEFALGTNRFWFVTNNFYGAENQRMMYGCDGVNTAFQFDGTVLTPILTGMVNDAPTFIEAHKNHLFLSFAGGSLQYSSILSPLVWSVVVGAGEIGAGDNITGLKSVGGDSMLIATDRAVYSLYGTDSSNWQLALVAADTGDVSNTLDIIGVPLITSKRGIVRIDTSQKYGNFESATVSRRINPLLLAMLNDYTVIGVNIIRDKNQYRIYFSNGQGIILTQDLLFGQGALPSFTTFEYPNNPACLASIAVDQGEEVILFGADNGFVYQEEKASSYDGAKIAYSLKLPWHHLGSPVVRKSFKWLHTEIDTDSTVTLRMTYQFSDGQDYTQQSLANDYKVTISAIAKWAEVNWSEFLWGSQPISKPPLSLSGTGYNISLYFYGDSATDSSFTINSITYQYLPRRLSRH